jgi:tetratricopeptide (TPR) repeat protein
MKAFGNLGRLKQPPEDQEPPVPTVGIFQDGHVIAGRYRVHGLLGSGGFGHVYLVQSLQSGGVYALKTFRDKFLHDVQTRDRFRQEAATWIALDRHPNIVRANSVDELDGRLYIALEFVAPDEDGINSLAGHLERKPPDLHQSLRWSIQCCHAMEHGYSMGIRAHRDIKPTNILIGPDGIAKITDFGLASAVDETGAAEPWDESRAARIGLAAGAVTGTITGTPNYMAPEQFLPRTVCSERTDLYAFGVVLFRMASGGALPFRVVRPRDSETSWVRFVHEIRYLHERAPIPRVDSPLEPILHGLLEKDPVGRYASFAELRGDLEALLYRQTGEIMPPPQLGRLDVADWVNKGLSLRALGRNDEAIDCFDNALDLDPACATAWLDKGVALGSTGRHEQSVSCYRRVVELDPRDVFAWNNLGRSLLALGRTDEALVSAEQALALDPGHGRAWNTRATILASAGHDEEALASFDRSIAIDPNSSSAWKNRGTCLAHLGHHKEAIPSFDRAIGIDPLNGDAWLQRGLSLAAMKRPKDAVPCFERALAINPNNGEAWTHRGLQLLAMGQVEPALTCLERATGIIPRDSLAWQGKGEALARVGLYKDSLAALDRSLRLTDPTNRPRLQILVDLIDRIQREAAGRR